MTTELPTDAIRRQIERDSVTTVGRKFGERSLAQLQALLDALTLEQTRNAMHEIVRASIPALVADNEVKDARIAELEHTINKIDFAIGMGYEPQIVRTKP